MSDVHNNELQLDASWRPSSLLCVYWDSSVRGCDMLPRAHHRATMRLARLLSVLLLQSLWGIRMVVAGGDNLLRLRNQQKPQGLRKQHCQALPAFAS